MTEEEKKRLGLTGQQPSRSQIVAPNTQAPAVPAAPAQPAAPAPATQPAAPAQPKPQPLAAPTPEQVRANLPGLSVGQQTRGAGGVRLDQQQAPAGKELIGMRSGVPIYADATDVYSNEASKLEKTLQGPTQSGPAVGASVEQMRAAYQTGPTATAVRAQQAPEKKPGEPANAGGFFSKEYADQFTAAQEAANQRAKERIAYGGQPVRDTSNSMAIANNAASALRNVASAPKTAGMEELKSYGFDKDTEKRLSFGVGPKGESINVTSDYLKDYAASQGITKRPGPTSQNPFLGANRPSNRIFRRPGL